MPWSLVALGGAVVLGWIFTEVVSRRNGVYVVERMQRRRDLKDDPDAHRLGSYYW